MVDAGRAKQKLLEGQAGLARFEVRWVSKASAEQRAGRAGRTGPGHCYRSATASYTTASCGHKACHDRGCRQVMYS